MAYEKLNQNHLNGENGLTNDAIKWAEKFAVYLTSKDKDGLEPMTTTQLRRFFSHIKQLEIDILSSYELLDSIPNPPLIEKHKNQLAMLKPLLAYAKGRDYSDKPKRPKSKLHHFVDEITYVIDGISNLQAFKNFVKLVEAIVAYHKLYENEKLTTETQQENPHQRNAGVQNRTQNRR